MEKDRSTKKELYPPCRSNCPVNTDVRGYVSAISRGDYVESYRLITERNPFPTVCGHVCPHPCEDECRRDQVDASISIARLKRFAAQYINDRSLFAGEPVKEKTGKKVAIIGAGPSGLTAAKDLAEKGHDVTVFEKEEEAGGMLAYGVPNFRLNFEDLNEDIARIANLGIDIRLNTEVGKDISFKKIDEQFDAIIISAGLQISRSIPIPGVDSEGVIQAIPFLKAANSGKPLKIDDKVVVVGGGDVAMDVARTALRTGAKEVSIACLECAKTMPAHSWEVEDAVEEGVKIYPSYGPKIIHSDDNKVKGIEFVGVTSVFDDKGCFNPSFNEKDKKVIEAGTVILSIGQASDLSFLKDSDVELNERGQLVTDPKTLQTSNKKVFGCGEVAKGPGAAIQAIAHAHNAAESADRFLNGNKAGFDEKEYDKLGEVPQAIVKLIPEAHRNKPGMRKAELRVGDYDKFEETFTELQALNEAHRCLGCTSGATVDKDKCAACLTCVRVCPYDVPVFKDELAYVDALGCQACGFCAADCPAEAIEIKAQSKNELNDRIKEAAGDNDILRIDCQYSLKKHEGKAPEGTTVLTVPCAGRIDVINMMKPFEYGFKKLIINCEDETCRHIDGFAFAKRRIIYVNKKLKELGYDDEAVIVTNEAKAPVKI